jgi:glycine/D-amino acid oxidase-like deaminating enzyme
MVATAPLSDDTWAEIGLERRETFHDGRHLVIYGQRTADGRFAFGGRGAPYHFGSAIRPEFDHHPKTHQAVEAMLHDLFPQIEGVEITHRWGGPVGMPRDLQASVVYDAASGMGSAGGYVGVGVAASHLAGQTLAELILGRQTERTALPWVGHHSRSWEPEPLRWAGVNLGRMLAPAADAMEDRTGRPSRVFGGMLEWLLGHG